MLIFLITRALAISNIENSHINQKEFEIINELIKLPQASQQKSSKIKQSYSYNDGKSIIKSINNYYDHFQNLEQPCEKTDSYQNKNKENEKISLKTRYHISRHQKIEKKSIINIADILWKSNEFNTSTKEIDIKNDYGHEKMEILKNKINDYYQMHKKKFKVQNQTYVQDKKHLFQKILKNNKNHFINKMIHNNWGQKKHGCYEININKIHNYDNQLYLKEIHLNQTKIKKNMNKFLQQMKSDLDKGRLKQNKMNNLQKNKDEKIIENIHSELKKQNHGQNKQNYPTKKDFLNQIDHQKQKYVNKHLDEKGTRHNSYHSLNQKTKQKEIKKDLADNEKAFRKENKKVKQSINEVPKILILGGCLFVLIVVLTFWRIKKVHNHQNINDQQMI